VKENFILDACALIAYFKQEPGFEAMTQFFDRADDDEISLSMHKLNLLEVYYGFYRDDGKEQAEDILADSLSLPIIIFDDLGDSLFREAGRLKALYDISFADSIALALTIDMRGTIITADRHEFTALEHKEPIRFSWIR
jgi:predicted nucleic acid-binding protein